jgi:hypothetical protein
LRVPRGRDISSCDVVKQGCLILVELDGMKLRVSRGVSGEFLEGAWIGQCLLVLNDLRSYGLHRQGALQGRIGLMQVAS